MARPIASDAARRLAKALFATTQLTQAAFDAIDAALDEAKNNEAEQIAHQLKMIGYPTTGDIIRARIAARKAKEGT